MLKEEIFNDKEKLKILSRVVAHYLGDGCVTNKYAAYFNKNDALLNNFERDITTLFARIHLTKGKYNSGTKLIQIQNKEIIQFLKELVSDYRSYALRLPNFVNNKELQKEFLRAIYDDEGCVALRVFKKTNEIKRNLTLASKSQKFIEEIKDLLEKSFNIQSNKINRYDKVVEKKIFTIRTLSITGKKNFERFREEIDFYHPVKRERLDAMTSSYIRK